jgi:putative ABC transport system permease protein
MGSAQVDGAVKMVVAVDPRTAFDIYDVKPLAGSPSDLGADAIAVFEDVAKEKNLKVGDRIPVLFATTGEKQMRVALIYGENRPAGDYFFGIAAYEANFGNNYDTQVFIKRAPGASAASALAAVKNLAKDYPGSKVLDQTGYKAEEAKGINQLLALVYVLLALAIVIALLGIGNTLALSIFERTRELGLLRAVGMTRTQLRSTVRWESVIIALLGTTVGLAIGLVFGWALVGALRGEGINTLAVPGGQLASVVVIAALAGVAAAIVPARRAARLDVLQAIASV